MVWIFAISAETTSLAISKSSRGVTSPNGTTFAGLTAMRAHGMQGVVEATVTACRDRSRELSKL